MKVSGSELINRALRAEGIDTVFAVAGDHTLHVMDVMHQDGTRFIDARHEAGAVHMANGWARTSGAPGVTLFTTPGQPNAVAGLALAWHMESPVVNIVGCAERRWLGLGAMQEIDQVGLARPVTKGAWLVDDPRRIPEHIARAFRLALTGRRGPVHLTIPVDVQLSEVDEDEVRPYNTGRTRASGRAPGDPDLVREAVRLLSSSRRPMIVAGNGAYTASPEPLARLAEVTGMPVFTEESARGLVPDGHPLCFGYADGRVNMAARHIREADALLFLGKKLDFTVAFGGPPNLHPDVRIVQVEPQPELVGQARGVDIAIVGDVGAVVEQLAAEAEGPTWSHHPSLGEMEEIRAQQRRDLESRAGGPGAIHAMDVHTALSPLLDPGACLVFEGSDFALFGAAYHPSSIPNRWFTSGTLGMIGWGVPFAIGARAALPESQVVLLTGDGSFGFHCVELDTAVRHGLDPVVLVGNDAVWGIDHHQQVSFFGRSVATELLPTRYDLLAQSLGAHGELVEDTAQIPSALQRAFGASVPAVVNVRTTPSPSPLTEFAIRSKRAMFGR